MTTTPTTESPVEAAAAAALDQFRENARIYQAILLRSEKPQKGDGDKLAEVTRRLGIGIDAMRADAANLATFRTAEALIDDLPNRENRRQAIAKKLGELEAEKAALIAPFDRQIATLNAEVIEHDAADAKMGTVEGKHRTGARRVVHQAPHHGLRRVLSDVEILQPRDFDPLAPEVDADATRRKRAARMQAVLNRPITLKDRPQLDGPRMITRDDPMVGKVFVGYADEAVTEETEAGEIQNVPGVGFVVPANDTGTDDDPQEASEE